MLIFLTFNLNKKESLLLWFHFTQKYMIMNINKERLYDNSKHPKKYKKKTEANCV